MLEVRTSSAEEWPRLWVCRSRRIIDGMIRHQMKGIIMLKKCLIAMMLAAALVAVIPASMASAALKSDAAVGMTPPDPDSVHVRIIDGNVSLNLSGHVVKAIGAELMGAGDARGIAACTSPFVPVFMPITKGVFLIKLMCRLIGEPTGLAVLNGIKMMITSPGTSPIGDNQCFQFRVPLGPVVPVIVDPSGNC
jgi:hypothetical protein